jgi:hypothetical protein
MHPSRGERPRKALAFQSGVSTPGRVRVFRRKTRKLRKSADTFINKSSPL